MMGFWPHCVALMAASPSLGLKGVFRLREAIPFIGDQVLASRAVQTQSCQSSGVIEWPIERRWWTAGAIDVDGGAQT